MWDSEWASRWYGAPFYEQSALVRFTDLLYCSTNKNDKTTTNKHNLQQHTNNPNNSDKPLSRWLDLNESEFAKGVQAPSAEASPEQEGKCRYVLSHVSVLAQSVLNCNLGPFVSAHKKGFYTRILNHIYYKEKYT